MRIWWRRGDRISGSVRGSNVQGPVAIGKGIRIRQEAGELSTSVSADELAELRDALDGFRADVEATLPTPQRTGALARVDELEEALTAPEPDPTTVGLVLRWFHRHAPTLAGGVVSVLVHPVVGKLVAAAGDAVAAEFEGIVTRND